MKNVLFALSVILLLAFSRLVPHAPNFTPVLAMAFWLGSQRVSKVTSIAILMGTLALSDYFLGFHNLMPVVYGSLVVLMFGGDLLKDKVQFSKNNFAKNTFAWLAAGLFGSVFFFVTTNLAVWYGSDIYAQNAAGLTDCFVMAIPFFHNTLASTWLFSAALVAVSNLSFVKQMAEVKS